MSLSDWDDKRLAETVLADSRGSDGARELAKRVLARGMGPTTPQIGEIYWDPEVGCRVRLIELNYSNERQFALVQLQEHATKETTVGPGMKTFLRPGAIIATLIGNLTVHRP